MLLLQPEREARAGGVLLQQWCWYFNEKTSRSSLKEFLFYFLRKLNSEHRLVFHRFLFDFRLAASI
jgi:hypothetical protein